MESGRHASRARHAVSTGRIAAALLVLSTLLLSPLLGLQVPAAAPSAFMLAVTCDMRYFSGPGTYDTPDYFRGAVEAIERHGGGAFMVSPGDIDPVDDVIWTIASTLGEGYLWYPVVGNHELPGSGSEAYEGANMDWLRSYDYDPNGAGAPPDIVNYGPAGCPQTTYSFDYANTHWVVLNEYCDAGGDAVGDGDVSDHLYDWLVADLAATDQERILVFGHEPAYPQPDADNGRERHMSDGLNQYPEHRDRFWRLLQEEGVIAYICGHTHNYSAVKVRGVWQLDAGHARGAGDTGAPSTFLLIRVDGQEVSFEAYRDVHDGDYDYSDILHSGLLYPHRILLPYVGAGEAGG